MLEGGRTKWRGALRGGARASVAFVRGNVDDVHTMWASLQMRVSVEGEVCEVMCRRPLLRGSICVGHGLTAASHACLLTVPSCSVNDMSAWS